MKQKSNIIKSWCILLSLVILQTTFLTSLSTSEIINKYSENNPSMIDSIKTIPIEDQTISVYKIDRTQLINELNRSFPQTSINEYRKTPRSPEQKQPTPVRGSTLYVGGAGGGNYSTIKSALENASNGDTIYIYSGTYKEDIFIDKSVEIKGENSNSVILQPVGSQLDLYYYAPTHILITANDVLIEDVQLSGDESICDEGIMIEDCDNVTIQYCNIHNYNSDAIYALEGTSFDSNIKINIINNVIHHIRENNNNLGWNPTVICYENTAGTIADNIIHNCSVVYVICSYIDDGWPNLPDIPRIENNTIKDIFEAQIGTLKDNRGIIVMDPAYVYGNIITNTNYGIQVQLVTAGSGAFDGNLTIKNNKIYNLRPGIQYEHSVGIYLNSIVNQIDRTIMVVNNIVNGVNGNSYNATALYTWSTTVGNILWDNNQVNGYGSAVDFKQNSAPTVLQNNRLILDSGDNSPSVNDTGIMLRDGSIVTIQKNVITGFDVGINISSSSDDAVIQCNAIFENNYFGVYNNGTNNIEATYNWWGDSSGPYHSITNPIGAGDNVSNYVDYYPWIDSNPPWSIQLDFTDTNNKMDYLIFGEKIDANNGEDSYDVPKPGIPPKPYLYTWFDADLNEPYNRLWMDYRSFPDINKIWDFYVTCNTTTRDIDTYITISWDKDEINTTEYTHHLELWNDTHLLADMQAVHEYTFDAEYSDFYLQHIYHFQIRCDVNDPPVITTVDDTSAVEDVLYSVDYEADDDDGDTLTWALETNATAFLSIVPATGMLSGTPSNADVGSYWVNVSVDDGSGGTDFSNFTLVVSNVNDPPVAVDDYATVLENSTDNVIDVLSNDTDPEGNSLILFNVSNPPHGTTSIYNNKVNYTPDINFNGTDIFTYNASDGNGGFAMGTVNVEVINLHKIIIQSKWNLISIPFYEDIHKSNIIVRNNSVEYNWTEAVAAGIVIDIFYNWNRLGQSYSASDTLEPGKGYWLWVYYNNVDLLIPSNAVGIGHITDLNNSWNIIGLPYNASLSKNNIIVNYSDDDYSWSQAVTNGYILNYIYGWDRILQKYTLDETLYPGHGYWTYAFFDKVTLKI